MSHNTEDMYVENKTMNKILVQFTTVLFVAIISVFGVIYGIDGEVARRDRENKIQPTGCIFESNCWYKR